MKKNDYEIVTLGFNCQPRGELTAWKLIPTKSKGRLSLPFDLALHSANLVVKQIKEDFKNYLKNMRYGYQSGNRHYWTNFNDSVIYYHDFHDKPNFHKKIIDRYQKRIENFRNLSKNQPFVFFLVNCQPDVTTTKDINEMYEALKEYRQGKPFRLLVWDTYERISVKELNPEIKIICDKNPEDNPMNAWDRNKKKSSAIIEHDRKKKVFIENAIKEEGFEVQYYEISLKDRFKYFIKYNMQSMFSITNNYVDNCKVIIIFGKTIKLWKLPED